MASIEVLKRKLRHPLPMRGVERRVYAAVVLVLLFGIAWSVGARDWQYFERAGSLVIVVGVGLTWKDLAHLVGDVESFYEAEFARLRAGLDAQRPTGLIASAMHDAKHEEAEVVQSNVRDLTRLLKLRLRTIEAAIVCMGTLVWGYGSIICNAIWKFA